MTPTITTSKQAQAICQKFNIPFEREHHRRIARARAMLHDGYLLDDRQDPVLHTCRIKSQTSEATYTVRISKRGHRHNCTCPDYQKHDADYKHLPITSPHQCKHIILVRLALALCDGEVL